MALCRMISYNIGQLAYMNAKRFGLKRVFFGGFFIRGHPYTMDTISFAIQFWSQVGGGAGGVCACRWAAWARLFAARALGAPLSWLLALGPGLLRACGLGEMPENASCQARGCTPPAPWADRGR
jgi:hypothetical protein